MAAFEPPWLSSMSRSSVYASNNGPSSPQQTYDPNPPTVAAFSPANPSGYSASSKQRSTIIVHKKSPLLVATPPQITRALAHSHPFLLPLNKLVGLLSWTTDDSWESYLLVAVFWAVTLYGGTIIRYGSPIIVVTLLILGMYSRRYSPLSSTSQTGEKHEAKGHKREMSEATMARHKSLDEIVDTLQEFTSRCNILLDPFLSMTDFLSTQRTPTSATTRPALTTLFIRILLVSPLWIFLTLPPFYIITPRRVILSIGTVVLSWHSRPARVSRVILWRSDFLRKVAALLTGLDFRTTIPSSGNEPGRPDLPPRKISQHNLASEMATKRRPTSAGVRFTFILYENQRRWIGLGWTTSLFSYERGPWTDEHLNPAPSKDEFELPDVEGGHSRWRWVDGSEWRIEHGDVKQHQRNASFSKPGQSGTSSKDAASASDGGGWIYYDNRWDDGRREDGWGRYTRRRKWFRDAELVEASPSLEATPSATPNNAMSDTEEEKVKKAKAFAQGLKASNASTATLTPASAAITPPQLPARPSITSSSSYASGTAPITIPTSKKISHSTSNSLTTDDIASSANSNSNSSKPKNRRGWFSSASPTTSTPLSSSAASAAARKRDRSDSKSSSGQNTMHSTFSTKSRDNKDDDVVDQWRDSGTRGGGYGGISEDVAMSLS